MADPTITCKCGARVSVHALYLLDPDTPACRDCHEALALKLLRRVIDSRELNTSTPLYDDLIRFMGVSPTEAHRG